MKKAAQPVDPASLVVFESLAANDSLSKRVRRTASSLAKKYKQTVAKELKSARDFAHTLYLDGHPDLACTNSF